jgi:hypothetical protein
MSDVACSYSSADLQDGRVFDFHARLDPSWVRQRRERALGTRAPMALLQAPQSALHSVARLDP